MLCLGEGIDLDVSGGWRGGYLDEGREGGGGHGDLDGRCFVIKLLGIRLTLLVRGEGQGLRGKSGGDGGDDDDDDAGEEGGDGECQDSC